MANVAYKGKVPVAITMNEPETRRCYDTSVGWVTVYFAKPDKQMDDKMATEFVRKQLEIGVEEAMKSYKR